MLYRAKSDRGPGFTLVEIIVAVAIFLLLFAASDTLFRSFRGSADMDLAVSGTVQALRHAQANAQNGLGDSAWGLKISSERAVIFKGSSYDSREAGSDQLLEYPFSVTVTEKDEIIFAKLTGLPDGGGGKITIGRNGDVRNITVNAKGTVTY
jgi:prepilin-type N-terminal cleavage/methylation domain-containing protein